MSYSKAPHSSTRPRWPVALLVIAGVSAVSVALGLTVVGPMIQRSRETPPPALRAAAPPAAATALPAEPAAEVEIKERVIPRPKPKPAITADVLDGSGSSVVPDSSPSAPTQAASPGPAAPDDSLASPARAPAKPRISAAVSEAAGDGGGSGGRAAGRAGAVTRPRATDVPKARVRRASPLEALPPLDTESPVSAASRAPASVKDLPTAPPLGAEARKSGRTFRVQVGRFDDRGEAQRLRDDLANAGFSPQIVRAERDGTVQYRVQIGTFKQRENAERQIEKLKQQSYEPFIAEDEP